MPQNTFLAVVILNATTVLYPHYATLQRAWGPTPLEDQRLAAGIMWLVGDVIFLVAIIAMLAAWMRAEGRADDTGRPARRRGAGCRSGSARTGWPSGCARVRRRLRPAADLRGAASSR